MRTNQDFDLKTISTYTWTGWIICNIIPTYSYCRFGQLIQIKSVIWLLMFANWCGASCWFFTFVLNLGFEWQMPTLPHLKPKNWTSKHHETSLHLGFAECHMVQPVREVCTRRTIHSNMAKHKLSFLPSPMLNLSCLFHTAAWNSSRMRWLKVIISNCRHSYRSWKATTAMDTGSAHWTFPPRSVIKIVHLHRRRQCVLHHLSSFERRIK